VDRIAEFEAAVRRHVTVVIPWDGRREDLLREAFRSLPKGVRVIVAKNAGKHEMATAFNEAIRMVETRYVFNMGADDIVDSKTLWRLWEAAIGFDGAYPRIVAFGEKRFRMLAEAWCPQRIQDQNVTGIMLIRTECVKRIGGYRDVPIEDWDLVHRLAQAGVRLSPAPMARYGYRQSEAGLHRRTLREASSMGLSWRDLSPAETRTVVPGVFYEWSLDGTGYVRCELPSRAVRGVVRTSMDYRDDHQANAWVFQYPNSGAQAFWDRALELGKKRVVDVDDNYVSDDLISTVREFHAENADAWSVQQESHKQMATEADYIICATHALAEVYREYNEKVMICENSCDPADWTVGSSKKKIVGVVLSRNHLKDIPLIEAACRAASKTKGVEVQVVGLDPQWDFSYTHIGFTPGVPSYRRVLSKWSIGLAPVRDNDLTRCKSDLKWLEFTMSGAILVASDSEAYKLVPDECLVRASDAKGFMDATMSVLQDESGRRKILRASTTHIRQYRLVDNDALRNRYHTVLA